MSEAARVELVGASCHLEHGFVPPINFSKKNEMFHFDIKIGIEQDVSAPKHSHFLPISAQPRFQKFQGRLFQDPCLSHHA